MDLVSQSYVFTQNFVKSLSNKDEGENERISSEQKEAFKDYPHVIFCSHMISDILLNKGNAVFNA